MEAGVRSDPKDLIFYDHVDHTWMEYRNILLKYD